MAEFGIDFNTLWGNGWTLLFTAFRIAIVYKVAAIIRAHLKVVFVCGSPRVIRAPLGKVLVGLFQQGLFRRFLKLA